MSTTWRPIFANCPEFGEAGGGTGGLPLEFGEAGGGTGGLPVAPVAFRSGDTAAVPEPSTFAFLGGVMGMGVVAYRRKKKQDA